MSLRASRIPRSALFVPVLAYLWLRLLNHLRIEWTVNEQYAYGWAVPFLCVYLLWRRGREDVPSSGFRVSGFAFSAALLLITAFIFTHWIEEANPDWRLVSWALALEVTAFTLVAIHVTGGAARLRPWAFPILFFLVAVPWPTPIEQPVIQALTRAIIAVTVEILNALGVAAVPHGNVIETAGGLVDIDEACSGIRSLQAVLMLALFFGELRQFNVKRRMLLCLIAFALACLFNLARTVTLSVVAARRGTEVVHAWHDPAGVAILVGCFVGVWLASHWLDSKVLTPRRKDAETQDVEISSALRVFAFSRLRVETRFIITTALLLLAGEVAVQLWYASAPRIATRDWTAELPRANPSFKQAELPKAAVRILRFNEGLSGVWQNPDGTRWQMIYLRWNPGRTAVHLARNHTPEICLPAAGKNLRGISAVTNVQAGGINMPFRCYTTGSENRPLYVFYSLWEDGAREQRVATQVLTRQARFSAVLERRRNPGQRVLEIAVWGARDAAHAEELLRAELPGLIH